MAFSPAGLAYLDRHAIPPALAASVGVHEREGALCYPYVREDGAPYYRRRLLGDGVTVQPTGEPLQLWFPAGDHFPDVLLCEGEADALAALAVGLPYTIAAIPGASFPAHRMAALEGRQVQIALDGDEAGRGATRRLGEALTHARAVPTPDGCDLSEFLIGQANRRLALAELIRQSVPIPHRPAEVRTGPREVVVDGELEAIPPAVYVPALTGQEPGRGGTMPCPLPDHDDRTPSFRAFPTAREGWFCYGCRAGGTIFDLAARMWGLGTRGEGFLEVKERLIETFGRNV